MSLSSFLRLVTPQTDFGGLLRSSLFKPPRDKEGEAGCFVGTSNAPEAPEAWAIDADGAWVMDADVGVSAGGGLVCHFFRCLHKPSGPSQAFFPCLLSPRVEELTTRLPGIK